MIFLPFSQEKQAQFNLYALIDGALLEGFYSSLSQVDKLRYKSLFVGTMDAQSAAVGPILLELKPDIHTTLAQMLLTHQTEYETPIWLRTSIAFTPLFNTLRKLLYIEKEDGSQHFFRYYDQQCFPGFLPIANKNPYYAGTMRKIYWAIWQESEQKYQYYHKDKIEGML